VRRYLLSVLGLIAIASVFVASACSSIEASQNTGSQGISQEDSQEIARQYVINAPTFAFDGMIETLALANTTISKCPCCWEFVYQFDCRQAGYGDRTGLQLAQVITPHTAIVVVQEGAVVSAVMDGKWDMMKQKLIDTGG